MTRTLTKEALERELAICWKQCTSSDPKNWTRANAAWGQCAITSLIVQDHLGGDIVRILFSTPDNKKGSHYLNILPGNSIYDATARQFPEGTKFMPSADVGVEALKNATRIHLFNQGIDNLSARDYLLNDKDTKLRYLRLASDVMRSPAQGIA